MTIKEKKKINIFYNNIKIKFFNNNNCIYIYALYSSGNKENKN